MSAHALFQDTAVRPSDDRATTFQAVQGEPEHYSGEALLVTAYAVLWVILLAWVALTWRKQNVLDTRLDALEREIAKADAAAAKASADSARGPGVASSHERSP